MTQECRWGDIELGPGITDAVLLADAVTGDLLDEAIDATDRSIVAVLARARQAGIARDISRLALDTTPAWHALHDGELVSLVARSPYNNPLVHAIHALRWGPPDSEVLAAIAAALFRADRAHAALDVIDGRASRSGAARSANR